MQGSGRFAERVLEIASFRAWLPRIGLAFTSSGRVELASPDAPRARCPAWRCRATGRRCAGRSTNATTPVVESPQGVYSLEGSMPYAFKARAEVERAALTARSASKRRARVDRHRFRSSVSTVMRCADASARRGRLQWTGQQPWNFDVDARSLAIRELRPRRERDDQRARHDRRRRTRRRRRRGPRGSRRCRERCSAAR